MTIKSQLDDFLAYEEKRAFGMAMIATGNRDEALDAVQDAMLAFVQKYSHKPTEQWAPLFYRMLQNRLKDWHRRRGFRSAILGLFSRDADGQELELQQAVSDEPDPAHHHHAGIALSRLETALQELPRRQQQAVLLRAWQGMDTRETATAMGVSEGSVKTHYSRGLQRLKHMLGEVWP